MISDNIYHLLDIYLECPLNHDIKIQGIHGRVLGCLLILTSLSCGDSVSNGAPVWGAQSEGTSNPEFLDGDASTTVDADLIDSVPGENDARPTSRDTLGEPTAYPTFVQPARCGPSMDGPELKPHLTEADPEYAERIQNMNIESLPLRLDLENLSGLDRWLLEYTLDSPNLQKLGRQYLLDRGLIGRAVLLALGVNPMPVQLDFRELRRGLYHFYNCDRGHPAYLSDFISVYGDYRTWPSILVEASRPKVHPRKLWHNDEAGIYIAETLRDGLVYETEIILADHRQDGALEFLTYSPDGRIASRGEFNTGATPAVGPSPYTCLGCHYDAQTKEYSIFP